MMDLHLVLNSMLGYLSASALIYVAKRSWTDDAFRKSAWVCAGVIAVLGATVWLFVSFPRDLLRLEVAKLAFYFVLLAGLLFGAPFWLQSFPSLKLELPAWDMGMEARNEIRKYKMILLLSVPVLFVCFLIWWTLVPDVSGASE